MEAWSTLLRNPLLTPAEVSVHRSSPFELGLLSGARSPGDGDGLPCAGDRSVKIIFCCSVTVRQLRQHQHAAHVALVTVTVTWGIALLTHSTLLRQVFASFAFDVSRDKSSSSTGE